MQETIQQSTYTEVRYSGANATVFLLPIQIDYNKSMKLTNCYARGRPDQEQTTAPLVTCLKKNHCTCGIPESLAAAMEGEGLGDLIMYSGHWVTSDRG